VSPLTKINISRIIPFGLIWVSFSIIYSLLEKGLLAGLHAYPSTGNPYNFHHSIIVTAATAFILGLFVGTIEVLYLNKYFIQMSFFKKIVLKAALYLLIMIGSLLIITIIFNSIELKASIFDRKILKSLWVFFTNFSFWSIEIYIAAVIVVSLFYSEVSENLGQGVLSNFFTGKYHKPVEEERIFMFLDMKSSTTIAENMGHVKYFGMLKEYFSDLTDPIIQFAGEIYQYVGDEIVVTWKLKKGLQDNNCIECFFEMKRMMKNQAKKYQDKFGLLPDFKAGFHFGKVITGEIGVVKKEIIFTGDVLNTTARIQGLCNFYKMDLLISGQLMKRLVLPPQLIMNSLGPSELRGRGEGIELFTIIPVQ